MSDASKYPTPPAHRLRVYAFDPQASSQLDSVAINQATVRIPWRERWEAPLEPGPINEYFEVIDVDPSSGRFYDPIDLNDPHVLAQDGLPPSEGDPRFHQQMVFAVAMKTVKVFERALGRKVYWSPRWDAANNCYIEVPRLRIYPHALREANAYYSSRKKALLFGYFKASQSDPGVNLPGGWVFTALSHDIVAHETTHAILDGMHRRYSEATSIDSLAFHEAFADIVALLMHFMLPEAVEAQIRLTGGSMNQRSWLSGLARQFGEATGSYAALREAIDDKDAQDLPDPTRLNTLKEPHARGAILVAAVFDAFVSIYQQRSADLLRLADDNHRNNERVAPELVQRLTREAIKSADHVLRMCIRALDYLPPVDVRFGEFLRAIITADTDLIPDDRMHYRLAMIQAFRRRAILPANCLSLASDSLLWETNSSIAAHDLIGGPGNPSLLQLTPEYRRKEGFKQAERNRRIVWEWLMKPSPTDAQWETALGVYFSTQSAPQSIVSSLLADHSDRQPAVEVHSVRTCRRSGPDGQDMRLLVIEITQRRRGYFQDPAPASGQTQSIPTKDQAPAGDFIFRGGATLLIDLRDGSVRYVIRKRIDDETRLKTQRDYLLFGNQGLAMTYHGIRQDDLHNPFAMTHRGI
jgi:hypothetical protein